MALVALCLYCGVAGAVLNYTPGLRYDFYKNSCPRAEDIVFEQMTEIFKTKPTAQDGDFGKNVAPDLLRLHFHDCFVRVSHQSHTAWTRKCAPPPLHCKFRLPESRRLRSHPGFQLTPFSCSHSGGSCVVLLWSVSVAPSKGLFECMCLTIVLMMSVKRGSWMPLQGCEGSVLMDKPGSEKTAPPNGRLEGFDAVDKIKAALEGECPGTVSCADLLAFAARDGVRLTGGFFYRVPAGRRDGYDSIAAEATKNLPDPRMNVDQLTLNFKNQGLTRDEMVILSGKRRCDNPLTPHHSHLVVPPHLRLHSNAGNLERMQRSEWCCLSNWCNEWQSGGIRRDYSEIRVSLERCLMWTLDCRCSHYWRRRMPPHRQQAVHLPRKQWGRPKPSEGVRQKAEGYLPAAESVRYHRRHGSGHSDQIRLAILQEPSEQDVRAVVGSGSVRWCKNSAPSEGSGEQVSILEQVRTSDGADGQHQCANRKPRRGSSELPTKELSGVSVIAELHQETVREADRFNWPDNCVAEFAAATTWRWGCNYSAAFVNAATGSVGERGPGVGLQPTCLEWSSWICQLLLTPFQTVDCCLEALLAKTFIQFFLTLSRLIDMGLYRIMLMNKEFFDNGISS